MRRAWRKNQRCSRNRRHASPALRFPLRARVALAQLGDEATCMIKLLLVLCGFAAGLSALPSTAASVTKTYSYFSIGGTTLDEIETSSTCAGPRSRAPAAVIPARRRWSSPPGSATPRTQGLLPDRRGQCDGQGQGHPAALAPARHGRTGCPAGLGHAVEPTSSGTRKATSSSPRTMRASSSRR